MKRKCEMAFKGIAEENALMELFLGALKVFQGERDAWSLTNDTSQMKPKLGGDK
jgi:hypothetical protein